MKRLVQPESLEASVVERPEALQIEIECPRCQDILILCSGFDYLYYSCDECGFVLAHSLPNQPKDKLWWAQVKSRNWAD